MSAKSARRERLGAARLRCVACGAPGLHLDVDGAACARCRARFPLRDGRLILVEPAGPAAVDALDRLKHPLKRFRRLYRALVWLVSPLYFDGTRGRFLDERVRGGDGVFVNLGSGNTELDARMINVDIAPYDSVDIVGDIAALPFENDSVDVLMNVSVLEHVADPARVVAEIRRVLRPGGTVYTDVPFVVGFHASPDDFTRWTDEGVRRLHVGFDCERVAINGGPTSALLWVFQEWVAIALSFGSRRLHTLVYLAVMLLTFPFKFLDVLLKRSPLARNIGSCFIYIGRKRAEQP